MSERSRVAAEVADRLRRRGIELHADDPAESLADLLSAVERFEGAVEAHGGDLMVDDLKSSQPDDSHFVLPRRAPKEPIGAYIRRVSGATADVKRHPPKPVD